MSLKRILAGILSASLVLTVALSGSITGRAAPLTHLHQQGKALPRLLPPRARTQGINLKSYKLLLIAILWASFSLPPIYWSGMKELKPSLSYKATIKAIQKL